MRSKISIALDNDNQPIIKVEYNHSEDVRDDMVKRFLETFGGQSSYASFRYDNYPTYPNSTALIRPLEPTMLINSADIIIQDLVMYTEEMTQVQKEILDGLAKLRILTQSQDPQKQ